MFCLTLQAPISWYYDREIVLCVIMLLYSHYINVTLAQWCWRCLWRLFIGEVTVVLRARQRGAPCSLWHQLLSIFMLSKASASITGCDGHSQMSRRDERQRQIALKKKKKIVKRRWYRPLAPDASVWLLFFIIYPPMRGYEHPSPNNDNLNKWRQRAAGCDVKHG